MAHTSIGSKLVKNHDFCLSEDKTYEKEEGKKK